MLCFLNWLNKTEWTSANEDEKWTPVRFIDTSPKISQIHATPEDTLEFTERSHARQCFSEKGSRRWPRGPPESMMGLARVRGSLRNSWSAFSKLDWRGSWRWSPAQPRTARKAAPAATWWPSPAQSTLLLSLPPSPTPMPTSLPMLERAELSHTENPFKCQSLSEAALQTHPGIMLRQLSGSP